MSRGFASNYRVVLVAIGLFVCFAGLGTRLVWLHVIDREELLHTIVKTRSQVIVDTARRGDILDAHGAILATSRPLIVVAVDPSMVRLQDEAKWPQLAQLLGMPLPELRRIFTTRYKTIASTAARPADTAAGILKLNLAIPSQPSEAKDAAQAPVSPLLTRAAVGATGDNAAGADEDDDTRTDAQEDAQGRRAIQWAKLSDHVTESTWLEIEKLGVSGLCPPQRHFSRVYPHNDLAAHIVGFANREGRGVAGIEAYADFYLRGQNGWREGEKDGRARELAQFQTLSVPRADGYSVRLSIDATVQDIVEQELAQIGKTYQPLKASIIVSDPRTGFILAMANYPTFNPNEYNLVPADEMSRMKNVAVADEYEPGSVFKIVAASAALEEGLVNDDTTFNCSVDRLTYRGHEVRLPGEDHHFDHPLSVKEIISHSSNRGAAQLAMRVGEEKYVDYVHKFGFGRKLGFPVGGEATGKVHEPGKPGWEDVAITNKPTITRMPMGQSVTATALQMHMAMSAMANGGMLLRPQVISEIRDTNNTVICRYSPVEIGRVVSERTARDMARLLQGVASPGGTAPGAAIKINGMDYEVAGKTGTAQKYMLETLPNGTKKLQASKKHHVASFIGFFPAVPPPGGRQVAISVIVDDADAHAPNGVAYGAAVAAPVFKSIGEKLIPILSITPPNQSARLDFVAATEGGHR